MHGTGEAMVKLEGVAKTFVMHLRGGATLPVLSGVTFEARAGECGDISGQRRAFVRRHLVVGETIDAVGRYA